MTLAIPDPDIQEIAQARLDNDDWAELQSLTPLQQRFVAEYVKDMNGTRACERAGYQGNENVWAVKASIMMKHPKINPLIRKLTAATADEMGLTREWLIGRLEDIAATARRGAPKTTAQGEVVKDDDGNVIFDWSPAGATRALELLARLRGDLVERQEIAVRSVHLVINGADVEGLT